MSETRKPKGIMVGELIEQLKGLDPDAIVVYNDDWRYIAAGGVVATAIAVNPENPEDWHEGMDQLPDWDRSYRDWPQVPGAMLYDVWSVEHD